MAKFVVVISDNIIEMLLDTEKQRDYLEKEYKDLAEKDVWRIYCELEQELRKVVEYQAWLQIWCQVKKRGSG